MSARADLAGGTEGIYTHRLARLISLAATLVLVLVSLIPAAAAADTYPDPVIYVQDGPVTRNPVVKFAILQPTRGNADKYRVSDSISQSGDLTDFTVYERQANWMWDVLPVTDSRVQLLDWPISVGLITMYAQSHYNDGTWSPVVSVTVSQFQANHTSLYVDSDPGLGLWSTTDFHTWSAVPATQIDASASTVTQGNRVSVDDGVWTVTFTYAGSITPGSYAVANSSTSCVTACVTIAHFEPGNSGRCVATSGSFDIDDISFQSGDLLSEAADFKIQCGLDIVAGSIRYGTAAGAVALDQDVDVIDFGEVLVGSTSQAYLTVTNFEDSDAELGDVAFTGAGAADYHASPDTCSGTMLLARQSCVVTITVAPTAVGWRRTSLSLPDGTTRGQRKVALETTAVVQSEIHLVTPPDLKEPGPARFVVTVTPPPATIQCWPRLFIDGQELSGYEGEDLTDPDRSQWIYNVDQLPNGTHALKAVYEECGYLLASWPCREQRDRGRGWSCADRIH